MQNEYLKLIKPLCLAEENLGLMAFKGRSEWGGFYEFELELHVNETFPLDDLLSSEIQWSSHAQQALVFGGIVKSIRWSMLGDGHRQVFVSVSSNLIFLKAIKKSRVFKRLSLSELMRCVFRDYPLLSYKIEMGSNSFRESWIQHDETDYDFLRRSLLEFNGYFCVDAVGSLIVRLSTLSSVAQALDLENVCSLSHSWGKDSEEISFSSSLYFEVDEIFEYQGVIFRVLKTEYSALENKTQANSSRQNEWFCRVLANTSIAVNPRLEPVIGFQRAKLVALPRLNKDSIQCDFQFPWDALNPISSTASLAQVWSSKEQGLQFIPTSSGAIVLHALKGGWNELVVFGSLNVNFQAKIQQLKTEFNDLDMAEDFSILAKNNESKEVSGDFNEHIRNNFELKVKDQLSIKLGKGAYNVLAEKIIFKSAKASIELSESEIKLSAATIELQSSAGVGQGLSRVSDRHLCPLINSDLSPHVGGAVKTGSKTVLINQLGAARMRDLAECMGPEDVIAEGIPDLLIEGQAAAYLGAASFHGGSLSSASSNVLSSVMGSSSLNSVKSSMLSKPEFWVHWVEL